MSGAAAALSPETVLAEMKKHGVTHVVYLPDSETNWLYLLMKADPAIAWSGSAARAMRARSPRGCGSAGPSR